MGNVSGMNSSVEGSGMSSQNISLTMKEITTILCSKCKKHLRSLVREKITDKMVLQAMGEEKPENTTN